VNSVKCNEASLITYWTPYIYCSDDILDKLMRCNILVITTHRIYRMYFRFSMFCYLESLSDPSPTRGGIRQSEERSITFWGYSGHMNKQ
jgi:hypothetical protein